MLRSSQLSSLHAELTEARLGRFNKKGQQTKHWCQNIRINLVPAENLTLTSFTLSSSPCIWRTGLIRWPWFGLINPCYDIAPALLLSLTLWKYPLFDFSLTLIHYDKQMFHFHFFSSTSVSMTLYMIPCFITITGPVGLTFMMMWSMSFGVAWQQAFPTTHNAFL